VLANLLLLCEPLRANLEVRKSVRTNLALHKNHAQLSAERWTPGDSDRARHSDSHQISNEPFDEVAKVLLHLNARKQQVCPDCRWPLCTFAPVSQGSSGATRTGRGGDLGRTAGVNRGDVQQGGTMGWGKGYLNVCQRSLVHSRCNTNRCVTGHLLWHWR
jgi:hypothetical protein